MHLLFELCDEPHLDKNEQVSEIRAHSSDFSSKDIDKNNPAGVGRTPDRPSPKYATGSKVQTRAEQFEVLNEPQEPIAIGSA